MLLAGPIITNIVCLSSHCVAKLHHFDILILSANSPDVCIFHNVITASPLGKLLLMSKCFNISCCCQNIVLQL